VDDEAGKDQMWLSKERGGTGAGIKGLHLGHMTVDLTDRNNKNDVLYNSRIYLNCYHDTRNRTMAGRHRVSMVSMNSPNSLTITQLIHRPVCMLFCVSNFQHSSSKGLEMAAI
jgi:hypothetical protein